LSSKNVYSNKSNGNRLNTSYKDHLIYCTKAPSSLHNRYLVNEELGVNVGLPCGSDFGSPIFPFLAIGGYNASLNEYWTGEAIIMNFINNNMVDTKSDEFKVGCQ
jgi:Niemann-Pick C1-like protein 1